MEVALYASVAAGTSAATFASISYFPTLSARHLGISCPGIRCRSSKATPYNIFFPISLSSSSVSRTVAAAAAATSASPNTFIPSTDYNQRHWMVLMETPPEQFTSKSQIIDYYANTLESVLGCKEDAQKCMYDASCDTHFGFCCDIDEETANELAGMPEVLNVKPDPNVDSLQKDYSRWNTEFDSQQSHFYGSTLLFPPGTSKHWLIRMSRPAIGAMRKAQVVDYFTQVLMRVLGSEKDAQMCIYHVSWQSNYGFCCELDDECAQQLAGVPGVLSVQPDENFGSEDKDYGGDSSTFQDPSSSTVTSNVKTKKIFVTGLSFYTSEKTLRAAFEGFGELVEVKVIMDKISKRSKGYAFVEYTTEDAASTALREMNGKIINGWMITVDVAKKNPPKSSGGFPRPTL